MPTVADVVVSALRAAGVHTLFGVPGGGSNLDLIAAAGRIGLPFILTSTETAAALSAIAQAEITGRPGACLTTLGPGAASVVNGVACAFLDRAPLVVFTDSHPTASAFEHQRLDQAAMLAPITKSSTMLAADHAARLVECALRLASAHPAGPVHLECPGDVASAAVAVPSPQLSAGDPSPQPSSAASSVATLLARARKPLMLVGLGARRDEDARAIRQLCERRRIPAMVTYKAKGVVPDSHPWFAGVFTNAMIERTVIDECDVLIGIGLDPVELLPRRWTHEQPIVYFGLWTVEDRHVPFAAQTITGIPAASDALEAMLSVSVWDAEHLHKIVAEQRRQVSIPAGGLAAYRVVEIAAAQLASRVAHVTVDAGAHMLPATMLWPAGAPNNLLISNGLSTMGFALPAAIGAAHLDRTRPVAALTGDGGLLMCLGELLTAVRERVRLITIVFSDASLSLIEIKQQARRLPAAGVSLGAIDWPALANSFGVTAWAASDEAEFERAVTDALACDGPSLIEARIDGSNYGATLRAVRGG
jgi:acetolactate synthase I/II/III large subunit